MNLMTYALLKKEIQKVSTEGLSIKSMEIVDGNLIMKLSNGTVIDAGKMPTSDSEALKEIESILETVQTSIKDIQTELSTPVEHVVVKKTKEGFPSVGLSDVLYKAEEEKRIYWWNPNSSTYEVLWEEPQTEGIENIKIINGGNANG